MSQIGRYIFGNGVPIDTITGNTGGPVGPDGAGNLNLLGANLITVAGNAGTHTETISLVNGTNGEIIIGGGAAPAWGHLTSLGGTIVVTEGANTLNIETAAAVATSYHTDAGNAVPIAGVLHIVGGTNVNTSGATNVITINATTNFAITYTNVAVTPYVVSVTDYYLSVDTSALAITIQLPNAPTANRMFVVKDRTGAAFTRNITVTTVGGIVLIDGGASYIMNTNHQAIQLLFNGTGYEII